MRVACNKACEKIEKATGTKNQDKKAIFRYRTPFKVESHPVATLDGLPPVQVCLVPSDDNPNVLHWILQMHFRDIIRPEPEAATLSGITRLRSPTSFKTSRMRNTARLANFSAALTNGVPQQVPQQAPQQAPHQVLQQASQQQMYHNFVNFQAQQQQEQQQLFQQYQQQQ